LEAIPACERWATVMVLVPRTLHLPERPSWDCEACGKPWPCAVAKTELMEQYGRWDLSLSLLLGLYLVDAIDDYCGGRQSLPADLHFGILGWAR
jgi:hypothetical protein